MAMKLLLTSGGLRNSTLVEELIKLVDKPVSEIKIAFIPTALNPKSGDKGWAINTLTQLNNMGAAQVDIVDISALSEDVWLPRLEDSDVIFVNGGDTTYLMHCFNNSGLTKALPKLLETRVYVGSSAGSYIATPDLRFNTDDLEEILDGLHYVDFGLQVHMNSPKYDEFKGKNAIKERIVKMNAPYTVYALDDNMAIKVNGSEVGLVGEGEYLKFEPN